MNMSVLDRLKRRVIQFRALDSLRHPFPLQVLQYPSRMQSHQAKRIRIQLCDVSYNGFAGVNRNRSLDVYQVSMLGEPGMQERDPEAPVVVRRLDDATGVLNSLINR